MKAKLNYNPPQLAKYSFENLPVGCYFIPDSHIHNKNIDPYLKVSKDSAFFTSNNKLYSHPDFFVNYPAYIIITTETVMVFTPKIN